MSTTDVAPVDALRVPSDVRQRTIKGARFVRNTIATWTMVAAFVLATIPLVYVTGAVIAKGAGVVSTGFLTADIPNAAAGNELKANCEGRSKYDPSAVCDAAAEPAPVDKPGMGPAVIGTLVTTVVSALIAIPLGLMAAIYLNEYGKKRRLARFIRFMTDVMIGVPSVVMGVFVYTLWVVQMGQGRSALAASIALACLMLPIVVRAGEEMLRLVPNSLREGSAALGARTWKTTTRVVLPSALPGLVSGSMLAVARAAGETAPVLFTIGTLFAADQAWTLTGQSTTLSFQIYNQITNGGQLAPTMAWGAALTLITLVLALTAGARIISSRFVMR